MNIVDKINTQIEDLQKKIARIQEDCSHPDDARMIIPRSSDGGYDGPMNDRCWEEHTCGLCQKRWDVNK